jgi:hypothetical protein
MYRNATSIASDGLEGVPGPNHSFCGSRKASEKKFDFFLDKASTIMR